MPQEKAAEIIDLNASRAKSGAGSESAGEFLRNARLAAGLSYEAISDATKIKVVHLEAIESGASDKLPATPYAVGFVRSYARYLGLDAEALAAQFREDAQAVDSETAAPSPARLASAADESKSGARAASVFAIAAIIGFIIWAGAQILGKPRADRAAPSDAPSIILSDVQTPAFSPRADTSRASPVIMRRGGQEPAAQPLQNVEPGNAAPVQEIVAPSIHDARLVHSVAPDYPEACAADAAAEEKVALIFNISPAGLIADARIFSSTNGCFNEEALSTLGEWRFEPRRVNGVAEIARDKQVVLNFKR